MLVVPSRDLAHRQQYRSRARHCTISDRPVGALPPRTMATRRCMGAAARSLHERYSRATRGIVHSRSNYRESRMHAGVRARARARMHIDSGREAGDASFSRGALAPWETRAISSPSSPPHPRRVAGVIIAIARAESTTTPKFA